MNLTRFLIFHGTVQWYCPYTVKKVRHMPQKHIWGFFNADLNALPWKPGSTTMETIPWYNTMKNQESGQFPIFRSSNFNVLKSLWKQRYL